MIVPARSVGGTIKLLLASMFYRFHRQRNTQMGIILLWLQGIPFQEVFIGNLDGLPINGLRAVDYAIGSPSPLPVR